MLKIFKKPVATILEAIKTQRRQLEFIDKNVRKLREMPETQTFTLVKTRGPIIDEWIPAAEIEAATQRGMAEDIGVQLLKAGAIEIETAPVDSAGHGSMARLCVKYRATIRAVVPKQNENMQAAMQARDITDPTALMHAASQRLRELNAMPRWIDRGPYIECPACGYTCNDEHYLGLGKFCPDCGTGLLGFREIMEEENANG